SPKAELSSPPIVKIAAVQMFFGPAGVAFAVHPVAEGVVTTPVAPIERSLLDVSGLYGCEHPMRVASALGDDVDDSVYSIRPPDDAAWTGDHLDSLDVLDHHVLHIPVHAAKERGVD